MTELPYLTSEAFERSFQVNHDTYQPYQPCALLSGTGLHPWLQPNAPDASHLCILAIDTLACIGPVVKQI